MKEVQVITKDFEIVNLTEIGKRVRNFSEKIRPIMENKYKKNFLNGGCYLFARIMKEHFKEYKSEYSSVGREEIKEKGKATSKVIDHVIIKIKYKEEEYYIDADGMGTKEDIINKTVYCDGIIDSKIKDKIKEEEIEKFIMSYKGEEIEEIMKKYLKEYPIIKKKKKKKVKQKIDLKI